jgi:hypothetical protein
MTYPNLFQESESGPFIRVIDLFLLSKADCIHATADNDLQIRFHVTNKHKGFSIPDTTQFEDWVKKIETITAAINQFIGEELFYQVPTRPFAISRRFFQKITGMEIMEVNGCWSMCLHEQNRSGRPCFKLRPVSKDADGALSKELVHNLYNWMKSKEEEHDEEEVEMDDKINTLFRIYEMDQINL